MATWGIWARKPQEQTAKLLTLWSPAARLRDPPAHLLQRHHGFPMKGQVVVAAQSPGCICNSKKEHHKLKGVGDGEETGRKQISAGG